MFASMSNLPNFGVTHVSSPQIRHPPCARALSPGAPVSAATVDLLLTGTLTSFGNRFRNSNIYAGAGFQINVSYDTDATLLFRTLDSADGAGNFYRFDNSSLVMTASSGTISNFMFANDVHGTGAPILVRDNFQQGGTDADTMRFTTVDQNNDFINAHSVDVQYDILLFSRDTSLYNITDNSIPLSPPDPAKIFRSFRSGPRFQTLRSPASSPS